MKILVMAFTLFASVCTTNLFANDGTTVAPVVLKSFQSKFANAQSADWSMANDLYKVHFRLEGQSITAFYREDGTIAALTRNLSPLQLPVSLQSVLKNDYKQYWIAGLFELSNDDGVQYYVTLEDADNTMILKSSAGSWSTFQKSRKQ